MIKEIVGKFVEIQMSNGAVLKGFIQNEDNNYFKMVEYNNNIIILNIEDISFVRLEVPMEKKERVSPKIPMANSFMDEEMNEFMEESKQNIDSNLSMPLPKIANIPYKNPNFIRNTEEK